MTEYQTYIVRCADGTLYTGIARDVTKRLAVHNAGDGAIDGNARVRAKIDAWLAARP